MPVEGFTAIIWVVAGVLYMLPHPWPTLAVLLMPAGVIGAVLVLALH